MIARWRARRAQAQRKRAIRRALEHHADHLGDPYRESLALARAVRRSR